uniref:Protein phosphatase 1 regulatory subunit 12B n=1 Tax=Ovis aries TaxID=9940 RepID=A0AC11DVW9_SHEEP
GKYCLDILYKQRLLCDRAFLALGDSEETVTASAVIRLSSLSAEASLCPSVCLFGGSALWALGSQRERLSRLESGGSDASTERASARARREAREARLATLSSRAEEDGSRDYRKLYESALTENQKLKTKLQEAQLELADVKSRLEKMAQKQDKTPERLSALETEKRERRALERKMSEMEEEVKVLTELKSDNQRLKDENGALIRVISKLSK